MAESPTLWMRSRRRGPCAGEMEAIEFGYTPEELARVNGPPTECVSCESILPRTYGVFVMNETTKKEEFYCDWCYDYWFPDSDDDRPRYPPQ